MSVQSPLRIARSPRSFFAALALCLVAFGTPAALRAEGAEGDRLLLYPDIHRDFVVFVHAGDLWRAPSDGGEARRLTSHAGTEQFPKISPDGEWIAFSAEYSGTLQVYVMPAIGGEPKQLTYHTNVTDLPPRGGSDYWVLDWTPDGEKILVQMNRTPFSERIGRYYLVDPDGGLETPLPIPHGGTASYSPDGTKLAYTPIDREFRTWKRSLGGRAQDLWTFDLEAKQSTRLTDYRGTDNFPIWVGDTIYFTSDRDYTLNLFALDVGASEAAGDEPRQVTDLDTWDVLWPSRGPDSIVFVQGGSLAKLDLATESTSWIPITLQGDRAHAVPRFEDVSDNIDGASLSPTGQRAIFEARGDLFSVPAEKGPTRNLTATSDAREHGASWSPDGRWLAYLSDATGEYEIYLRSMTDGSVRQLTSGGSTWRFEPAWSPDSAKLAFADRDRHLRVIDVASGGVTEIDRGFRGDLRTYEWSPDSRWLAYERLREDTRLAGISLYSLDSGEIHRLGDGLTADFDPAWSADGRHLFFLSNRDYNITFSDFEFDYLYDRSTRVYVAALDPTAPALFPPESDEEPKPGEKDEEKAEGNGDAAKKDEKKADTPARVEPEGFAERTIALPGVGAGNYANLVATEGAVYFLRFAPGGPPTLERYDLAKREHETVSAGARGFELSHDGKKLLYAGGDGWHLVDAQPGQNGKGKLDLSGLRAKIDPAAEWRQMYDDAWRITRDWFYDPDMHGMDWQALGERYRALVPKIAHRSELDWILGELIGELGAGHTYVQPGEVDEVERVEGGTLGADLVADGERYRIEKIFAGENWREEFRSPLTEPGVDVSEGDYLLAIDGFELTTAENPFRPLEGKAGEQVTLTVNDTPSLEGAREVVVVTRANDQTLRYIDWVKSRMEIVDRLSNGRIGYIHLPNTAIEGNVMLQKLFYGQTEKEALIVDDRYNGGGFIPDVMIEYLSRTNMAYWAMRDIDSMRTPAFAHDGPKAMLMNGYSSSGGDALPYFFRQQGLGPLIGTRTWGGLIGLNGNPPLMDGGGVAICTFRIYDAEGNWVVENEGVVPDHEVFDVAEAFDDDSDPSIEKAVEVLLAELAAHPVAQPERPAPPNLSREAMDMESQTR